MSDFVREMKMEDLEKIINLLKEFQKESFGDYGVDVSPEYIRKISEAYKDSTFVLEQEGNIVGVLVLSLTLLPVNGEIIAEELVWYVSKKFRRFGINLLTFAEKWCIHKGIRRLIMVCMANSKAKVLERFYMRQGYEPMQVHYIKKLGG